MDLVRCCSSTPLSDLVRLFHHAEDKEVAWKGNGTAAAAEVGAVAFSFPS